MNYKNNDNSLYGSMSKDREAARRKQALVEAASITDRWEKEKKENGTNRPATPKKEYDFFDIKSFHTNLDKIVENERILAMGSEAEGADAILNAHLNIETNRRLLREEGLSSREIDYLLEKKRQEANKQYSDTVQKAVEADSKKHPIGATVSSIPLKLMGGAMGTFDLIGQTAEKLLTGGKEPVDLYGSAQLFDNVARGARETAGETLLGEDDRWKYDLAMTTTDDFIEDKMKGIGTILGTSSSFLGHFKDAKERESSDGEAWNYALTATGLELVGDKADKNTMRPYVRETLEQMGLNRFANLIK